ncbi:MAG: universal stress protein [Gammaproteobacteria bacterium]|nr:universal stress protein [Gammaproteobacteria bacterium]
MFKQILFPVDLEESEFAQSALEDAIGLAKLHAARLHVLSVVPGYSMPLVASFFPEGLFEKACNEVKRHLEIYVREKIPSEIECSWNVRQGHPAENIVEEARKHDVDLIVMPSHTRSHLDKRLIGSCASRVVELARCSVMVVRS